jgi:hypothetical protein
MTIASPGRRGRISCPKPQETFEPGSEHETRDHIAHPMRQHDNARQRKRDGDPSEHPARSDWQCSGGGSERAHVQRVAGRECIVASAGKRNAVNVTQHRRSIGTGLIERRFESMRQQRCRDRDQERMVAGPPQGLVSSSRGDPAGGRQNEQELFIGAPGQRPGNRFGDGFGVSCDGAGDHGIERCRPYGKRGRPARAKQVSADLSDSVHIYFSTGCIIQRSNGRGVHDSLVSRASSRTASPHWFLAFTGTLGWYCRRSLAHSLTGRGRAPPFPPFGREQSMLKRRRFKQSDSREARLSGEARTLREQATRPPPRPDREALHRDAPQDEAAAHLTEWLTSPGLRRPT